MTFSVPWKPLYGPNHVPFLTIFLPLSWNIRKMVLSFSLCLLTMSFCLPVFDLWNIIVSGILQYFSDSVVSMFFFPSVTHGGVCGSFNFTALRYFIIWIIFYYLNAVYPCYLSMTTFFFFPVTNNADLPIHVHGSCTCAGI